ncbi:MAG TPA: hypothetical protein VHB23_03520 [Devosiaceae bacterium]|jgi:hypothetical protein|nr:hypothetical protein [Devosiaceae bacterium]
MSDIHADNALETDGAGPSADKIKSDLSDAKETLRTAAGDLADKAQNEAAEIKDLAANSIADATRRAKSFAAQHKDVAADQMGGVSSALSKVADELESEEQTAAVAGYARELANGVARLSSTMRGSSVDELMDMTQDFGRRQPVAFLGAALLAGFAAGRFVIASAERRSAGMDSGAYDPDRTNAYGSTARDSDAVADIPNLANTSRGGAFE